MNFRSLYLFLMIPALLFMSACHHTPDHAKYIPKDALMVAEVNTKELSKKIAWSMITGSNLWDKLRGSNVRTAQLYDLRHVASFTLACATG